MKTYKVTVFLKDIPLQSGDEESVKEEVKEALTNAIDADDDGDEELEFSIEVDDSDDF